uniref:Putative fungistatic metabolite n=1 Tax=Lygus hesperus TaxID=30085 RepID=A0A0A9YX64_LYGHE
MIWRELSVCLVLLVLSIARGWSMNAERHARDLKILSKFTANENHQIHKENLTELTITGDPSELQALIRAIEHLSKGGVGHGRNSSSVSTVRPTIPTETDQLNYLGCYVDFPARLMKGATANFPRTLTPEICLTYCKTKGMRYFGLQYRSHCFCSISMPAWGVQASDIECNMKCDGNPRKNACGGWYRLSMYESMDSGTDQLNFMGCFKDSGSRLMTGAMETFAGTLTPEICRTHCKSKGMRYFGLEYSNQCFCSVEEPLLEEEAAFNECNMKCAGNPGETCGGWWRLSVYEYD